MIFGLTLYLFSAHLCAAIYATELPAEEGEPLLWVCVIISRGFIISYSALNVSPSLHGRC